ncbi:MAG: sugar phosphate isomerase/epimerase [Planctomycetes bacterium]|nr:sugar phosphate isomerase/epimerase [Planctomycetota bacterium]
MLKRLGYDGIGYTGTKGIPEMLAALDRFGLKMFSTYVRVDVGPKGPRYDPGLPGAIQQLKGRPTIIWLYVIGKGANAEQQTVRIVREIADLAAQSGLKVATYPHTGFYIARVEDSVRIAKKVDRPNVGASFNLCHWLKVDGRRLEARLTEAMPYLYLVSINGADAGDTRAMGWDRLIQTLDRGTYDVAGLLKRLRRLGYRGPIGLQCYNIPGAPEENLRRSIQAWKKMWDEMEQ